MANGMNRNQSVLDIYTPSQIVGEALNALSNEFRDMIEAFRFKQEKKGIVSDQNRIWKNYDLFEVFH